MLHTLLSYAGYGLAIILAFALLIVGLAVRNVLALRLRTGRVEAIPCDRLPAYVEPLCTQTERRLRALGFEPFLCERQEEMVASPHAVRWARVYIHLDEKAYASVAVATLPDARNACEVEFVSFFADGQALVTMDGKAHMILRCLDWLRVQDGYSGDLDAQWALHREGIASHAGERAMLINARAYGAWGNRLLDEYPRALSRGGWVRPAERADTYRFGFLRALRFTLRLLRHSKRSGTATRRVAAEPATQFDGGALAQAQASAYQRQTDAVRHRPGGWLGKTALFVLSGVLFVLAFGITFSFEMVLIILGVLLLHELGHVLAMRAFGYRDLQILFIPFLGAAARGQPRQPKVYQQVIVSLMGPLPGIAIGYGLMHAAGPELGSLLWQIGLVMLVLNYLNLLPVMPLDGGQITNLLLFSRYPRLRGLFTLASGTALAYAAWAWSEPVLWALAALMLLSVSGQMQIATLLRKLPATRAGNGAPDEPETAVLERVFGVLGQTSLARRAFMHQYQFVRGALEQVRLAHASWPLVLGGLTLYGALLVAPPWLVVRDTPALAALFTPGPEVAEALPEPPDWEGQLAQATSTEARWGILMEAGDWLADSEQAPEAAGYYARAEKLAEGFGADDPRLARTLVKISALGEGSAAEERSRLERALAIQERALGPENLELAATLEALAMVQDVRGDDAADPVGTLRRALAIRRQAQGERHPDVAQTLTALAYIYDELDRFEETEAAHRSAAAIYLETLGASDPRTRLAEERLASLYLDHGDYGKAILTLDAALQRFPNETSGAERYARSRAETMLGWAEIFQGDRGAARPLFEAALRDHSDGLGTFAGDVSRVPLLLDLVYLHASQGGWNEAQEPYQAYVSLTEEVMRTSPEAFAAHLEGRGGLPANEASDWSVRRRRAQAQGIRLMLER